jgi:L-threonylcarbamoyladenylate synthase
MVDTQPFEHDIKEAVAAMQAGGVILYPTDTVWGLGCDATNEEAVQKLFRIKARDAGKSMIVLLADPRDVLQHVAAPPPDIFEQLEAFEVPTTVIYEGGLHFADSVTAADGSIGIRVTTDPFCRALIKRFRRPIVSTSANISGMPAPQIFREISPEVRDAVDHVVQWRQADETRSTPSRIARFREDGSLEYLR